MSRLSWLGKSQHKKMQHEVSTQLFCQLFLYCRYQILSIYFDLDLPQKLGSPCLVFGLGCIGYQSSHAIIRARRSKPKQNETSKLFVWKWKNEYCTLKNIQTTISEIICFAKEKEWKIERKKKERKIFVRNSKVCCFLKNFRWRTNVEIDSEKNVLDFLVNLFFLIFVLWNFKLFLSKFKFSKVFP